MKINQEKYDALRRILKGNNIPDEDVDELATNICRILVDEDTRRFEQEETEGWFPPSLEIEWEVHYSNGKVVGHTRSYDMEDKEFEGEQDIVNFKSNFQEILAIDAKADGAEPGTSFDVFDINYSKHDPWGDWGLDYEEHERYYYDGESVIPEIN